MDYKISLSESGNYVIIQVMQPMTSELGHRCGTDAARLAGEKKTNRFLFDLRESQNIQTVIKNYDFAYEGMMDFGFPRASISALLIKPGDKSHDFIETAFLNAGYNVKIFTNEKSAIAWLEYKHTDKNK